jgi:predicted short-subunit dehydrogenase-like oxidoreductase (DUF2520 family)
MRIVIIGSGNVAYHLIHAFCKTNATIFVHARNKGSLDLLKLEFPSITILANYDLTTIDVDLVLISVKDDVLNDVFEQYTYAPNTLVAHTSGNQTIQPNQLHQKIGVFYPLQTFSKSNRIEWNTTPILMESSSEGDMHILERAAALIRAPFFETDEIQRKAIHVAAVLTSNFANHLMGKAAVFLKKQDIDYHILQPLVMETIRKAFANNPFDVQTGPAIRNDRLTLAQHLEQLKSDTLLQKIYTDITESIQKTSNLDTHNE